MQVSTNYEREYERHKYDGATLDTPFFHLLAEPILPCLRPILSLIFAIRWQLSRPLQTYMFPQFCSCRGIPLLGDLVDLTLGQVLLVAPLIGLLYGGYKYTFVTPDPGDSGWYAAYSMYAVFLTANKTNSVFAFLLGIPFERMIPYHKLSALVTVVLFCLHAYSVYMDEEGESGGDRRLEDNGGEGGESKLQEIPDFLFGETLNLWGSLMAISTLVLIITSVFPIFRRTLFELWLAIHIPAAICVVIFGFLHEVTPILFIGGWWVVDVLLRYIVMANCRYPRQATLDLVTRDVVKVSFPKLPSFSYNAGQFVQIAFPVLGCLEFHPISISSAPHESEITLHIKASGGWSSRLVALASTTKDIAALVEGPYGSSAVDMDAERYQMVLLVCGGIGVTPCNSIAKSLIHNIERGTRSMKEIHLVWSVRDLDLVTAMGPLSNALEMELQEMPSSRRQSNRPVQEQALDDPPRPLKTSIYLTKSSESTQDALPDGRKIIKGRPDLYGIMEEMKNYALANQVSHVVVFGCGPTALIHDMKSACRKTSRGTLECGGVKFDIHEEIFHF